MKPSRYTRLRKLEAEADPLAAVMRQDGLAALLRAAQLMPPLNPEDADLTASPFGPLLAEARAWCKAQEEADHKACHDLLYISGDFRRLYPVDTA